MPSGAILTRIQTLSSDVEEITLKAQERSKDHSHVLREPNPLQRSQLCDTIIQNRFDVQRELGDLKLVEEKFTALRILLEKQHAFYISQTSPIHALPLEILARIFDWTNHGDDYLPTSYRPTLMRVSKSWNHFIQRQPSLWTFYWQRISEQTNPTLDLSIVRQRFARSGALPLRLQIYFEDHHPSIILGGSSLDLDASWLTRVVHLHIIAHGALCFEVINGFRSFVHRGQLSSLRELDVIARDPPDTCEPCEGFGTGRITMLNDHNPLLSNLFLNGDIVDLGTIQLSSLKSLTLVSMDIVSWSSLKGMLSGNITIEYLRIDEVQLLDVQSQDNDDSPISLPCLRDLQIQDNCASTPLRLIRGLRAPLLKKFTFAVDFFYEGALNQFLFHEMEDVLSLAGQLRKMLSASTYLEELILQAPPETIVLLVLLLLPSVPTSGEIVAPRPGGGMPSVLLAPKLHSLNLSFCPNVDDHTYMHPPLKLLANIIRMVHDARADSMYADNQGAHQGSTRLQSIRVPSCLFYDNSALAGLEAAGWSYTCICPDE